MYTIVEWCKFVLFLERASGMLRGTFKAKSTASSLARKALEDLRRIWQHCELLGCNFTANLTPSLLYNVEHFSGVIFQVAAVVKKNKRAPFDVLAAGGRYDALVR